MDNNWATKDKDLTAAEKIMETYAKEQNAEAIGLFELVVNTEEKRMNFRLSNWVLALVEYFSSVYGVDHGDFVTRKVITQCFTSGQTIH